MSKRFIIALTLGVFLSVASASGASASHIGFTINGQPNDQLYECAAPCTVQVYDPDGGSPYWDFEYNRHSSFVVQASGNPVSWTYQEAGLHTIFESADAAGNEVIGSGGVRVIPAEESAPEDIELVNAANGKLEFTTSRRNARFICGNACDYELGERTGPDSSGRYHYFLVVTEAPPSFELRVEAWNTFANYKVQETFTITSGSTKLFVEGKASWKVRSKGSRCVVKFSQRFKTALDYEAKLTLVAVAGNDRERKIVRRSGQQGRSRTRGKLVLPGSFASELPGKATALLSVKVAEERYRAKDTRKLKAGCR